MIGKKIKELRINKNLSQEEFGLKLNHTKSTISKWENNLSIPDFLTLQKIATTFNIEIGYFASENYIEKETNSNIQYHETNKLIALHKKVNYSGLSELKTNILIKVSLMLNWIIALSISISLFIVIFLLKKSFNEETMPYLISIIVFLLWFAISLLLCIHMLNYLKRKSRWNSNIELGSCSLTLISVKTQNKKSFNYKDIVKMSHIGKELYFEIYLELSNKNKITLFSVDQSVLDFISSKIRKEHNE